MLECTVKKPQVNTSLLVLHISLFNCSDCLEQKIWKMCIEFPNKKNQNKIIFWSNIFFVCFSVLLKCTLQCLLLLETEELGFFSNIISLYNVL